MTTYIFMDVDGVLIKCYAHDPAYRQHWDEEVGRDLGIQTGVLQTHFFKPHWPDVIIGKRDLREALTEILPAIGFAGSAQDIIDCWFKTDSDVDLDLLAMLKKLKDKAAARLYLATNQEKMRADFLWDELKFGHLFDGIYYSGKLGIGKPDPLFFSTISNDLAFNRDQDQILFFDDAPANVAAAKATGWQAFPYETIEDFAENPFILNLLAVRQDHQ